MSREETRNDPRPLSVGAAVGYGLLCALFGLCAWLVVRQTRTTVRARRLSTELLGHESRLHGRRFIRPSIADTPNRSDCDSVLDAIDALRGLDLGDEEVRRLSIASTLIRGTEAPQGLAALPSRNRAQLDAFLRSAACPHVRVSRPLHTAEAGPEYGRILRGVLLIALRDRDGDPTRCLDSVVRSVRVLSDLPYAAGYLGLVMPALVMEPITLVALRCARRADHAAVTAAWQHIATIAALPLPEGEALVFERLAMARPLRDEVFRTPTVPTSGDALNAWAMRPRYVEGWAALTDGIESLPERTTSPAEAELRVEEHESILQRMSTAFSSGPSAQRFLHRGRAGHAWLRLLAMSLDAIARVGAGSEPGTLGEPQRNHPSARDPFTHREPLHWARNHHGAFIAWSVGPDGHDAHGSGDDVLLTVPGPPGAPEQDAHDHGPGHHHDRGAPAVPTMMP